MYHGVCVHNGSCALSNPTGNKLLNLSRISWRKHLCTLMGVTHYLIVMHMKNPNKLTYLLRSTHAPDWLVNLTFVPLTSTV